ncbi:Na+/H+-dicarboxylate symporter [Saccharopolyspora phatthalungensis]|uniref:Na+/H+-dicarboxylate symporter n=1 Tax=Saccharopolyspora phatthalungensis TaxID=664693 RepID=A0A840QIT5_9PSEU|nr:Na+/H+-dicarboxylate symporter [Saccharopolyspora phatthalungensis]
MALGVALGMLFPAAGPVLKVVGELFLNLIEMMLVPLLFPLVALSIANIGSLGRLGRLAGKSILYFEIVTTVILLIGLVLGNVTNVGSGVPVGQVATKSTEGLSHGIDFEKFLLDAVPSNIFAAFSTNNLLAVIVFGLFFGLALAAVGERAASVKNTLDALSEIMLTVIRYVIRLSPLGVFGYVGYAVATYGFSLLVSLGHFIVVVYAGCLLLLVVIFPAIAMIFRVQYFGCCATSRTSCSSPTQRGARKLSSLLCSSGWSKSVHNGRLCHSPFRSGTHSTRTVPRSTRPSHFCSWRTRMTCPCPSASN